MRRVFRGTFSLIHDASTELSMNGLVGNFPGLSSSHLGRPVPKPESWSQRDLNEAAGGGGRLRVF
jgi:hypothetical protein